MLLLSQKHDIPPVTVIFLPGMTGVASTAPTSDIVQHLFGTMRLPGLFDMIYPVHQVGAFCSARAAQGSTCRALLIFTAAIEFPAGSCYFKYKPGSVQR